MAPKKQVSTKVVAPVADEEVMDSAEPEVVKAKAGRPKKATAAPKTKKAGKAVAFEDDEEVAADENIDAMREEKEDEAAEAEEEEPKETAAVPKPKRGGSKKAAPVVEEKEEEEAPTTTTTMAPVTKGRGKKAAPAAAVEKKEEEPVADAPVEEEEAPAEEPVKAKGGRKPAAKKGAKAAAAAPAAEEKEEEKAEEEADAEMKDEEEEVAAPAAKKGGRKAAKAAPADEPEKKKVKKDEEEEEEKPVKKGRAAAAKKAAPAADEEEDKPSARPKRGAATKAAAAAKKAAEDDEEEEEEKPARGKRGAATKAAAATKKAAEEDDDFDGEEEEKEEPKPAAKKTAGRGKKAAPAAAKDDDEEEKDEVKPAAKGRGRGKKAAPAAPEPAEDAAAAADEDEDEPKAKKIKKEEDGEDEEENGKSGGKSMTKSIRRTVQVKGKAAVDPLCTRKASHAHVYEAGDLIYDVMLNQTNIGNNNNKYYVIQLLEDDSKNEYSVWFRWGRVGYDGQNKLVECGTNLQRAIKEFSSKFEAKTKNEWPTSFEEFETHHGKYTMIEMDYGSDAGGGAGSVKIEDAQEEEEKKSTAVSKLDERVQKLMHLMCSIRTMTQAVKELEFDADKSPLGKITQYQIKEGYACLARIEEFINKESFGAEFKQAVNEYYTKVPHACGFRPPALIKSKKQLKNEIELLDLLAGIEYAIKTMKEETVEDDVHPVDRHYASLKCDLKPMEDKEEEYKLVAEYLKKTHGATHSIQMDLKNVYRVEREGEEDNEEQMEKIGNRKLLWHGSRLSNFFGILSQGLRIAPPEAPCTGYMFGKGVYFADMATKSGNYCYASEDGQTGFLLLAEVALGSENQLKQADYNANKLPAGKNSTWGIGRTMPDPAMDRKLGDKVTVPCGKPITNPIGKDASLLYNEFIVYNTQQIRMRYLLEVTFNFNA